MTKHVAFLGLILLLVHTGVSAQTDIHGVNFRNFTYLPYCAGDEGEKVTVKNGEFSSEKQMDGYVDRFYFSIFDIQFGDLTGDGKDEAVILSVCNTGGTGNFSEGFIYTMRNGKPTLAARIPGGDRAYGGLRSARVEKGVLVVETNDPGEHGAGCCPEYATMNRYKLSGDRIVAIGKPVQRELFPTERIRFSPGTSGTTFEVTIPAREGKRFVVAARARQTLRVSTSSNDVALRLLGDAVVTEGINNFTARLPKTGDYTFELQNQADTELTVTVNVKIQ